MNQETNAPKTNFDIAQECGADFYPSVDEPLMTFTTDELDNFASRICTDKDAEIARLNKLAGIYPSYYQTIAELEKETAQLKALVAMQAEALKFYAESSHFTAHQDVWESVSGEPCNFLEDESNTATIEDGSVAKQVLSASAESVAAWEAKKLEPLRKEVSMLHNAINKVLPTLTADERCPAAVTDTLQQVVAATQATAEAYDREVKAKALEEPKRLLILLSDEVSSIRRGIGISYPLDSDPLVSAKRFINEN